MTMTEHPVFDRSTKAGRAAEIAYLDSLDDAQLATYPRRHRFVTRGAKTTPEREARLREQLADAESKL